MRVTDLEGFQLDYWVAMAEGEKPYYAPGDPRILVEGDRWLKCGEYGSAKEVPKYSTSWGRGGQLIEKYDINVQRRTNPHMGGKNWIAQPFRQRASYGESPLQAICRAVVGLAFGDEVQEGSESNG